MTEKRQPETAASATASAAEPVEKPALARNRAARDRIQFPSRKKSTGARSTRSGKRSLDTPTLWPADQIERRDTAKLIPHARNARRHRSSQIAESAASIKELGWTVPILVDETNVIIAGHGRVLAAERLGIKDLPVCVARGWSEQKKRAYRLADNEIPLHAQWDKTLLRVELAELREQGVDLELMGFAA
jgi:ParB-like chromosome segregation protein Spo0J